VFCAVNISALKPVTWSILHLYVPVRFACVLTRAGWIAPGGGVIEPQRADCPLHGARTAHERVWPAGLMRAFNRFADAVETAAARQHKTHGRQPQNAYLDSAPAIARHIE
jgi:uncharacterized membrane protein